MRTARLVSSITLLVCVACSRNTSSGAPPPSTVDVPSVNPVLSPDRTMFGDPVAKTTNKAPPDDTVRGGSSAAPGGGGAPGGGPVPEPTTLLLLGSGVVGIALLRRRRSTSSQD